MTVRRWRCHWLKMLSTVGWPTAAIRCMCEDSHIQPYSSLLRVTGAGLAERMRETGVSHTFPF